MRIATFNCHNLFARYIDNKGNAIPAGTVLNEAARGATAGVIQEAAPDILAVQEVEHVYALRAFNDVRLGNGFRQILCIDGNDDRQIDVGIMVAGRRGEGIGAIRSHADDPIEPATPITRRFDAKARGPGNDKKTDYRPGAFVTNGAIFNRDCLEIDIDGAAAPLTMLVCHLKSQRDAAPGEEDSNSQRRREAERVAAIVDSAVARGRMPIVLGDLNLDPARNADAIAGRSIAAILDHPALADAHQRLPNAEHWSHFWYDSEKDRGTISRLDYIMVDRRLKVADAVYIRSGISKACNEYSGPRLPGVTRAEFASDHCLAWVDLDFA